MTKIEWTNSTWNPVVGCSIVSPGCTNCYAMKMAARIEAMNEVSHHAPHYKGLTKRTKAGPVWTGKVSMAPEATLLAPLRWKKPRMVFVNSMSDLFQEGVSDEQIDRIFAVMALTPQHTYQVLTKRPERMREYFQHIALYERILHHAAWLRRDRPNLLSVPISNPATSPLPNVWLGVSTERQKEFEERWPHLQQTPAARRFISYEPALGALDPTHVVRYGEDGTAYIDNALDGFRAHKCGGSYGAKLDWVIAGGESGPGARPMYPEWARQIRDQCVAARVPFFFKQWGEWIDWKQFGADQWKNTTPQRASYKGPTVGTFHGGQQHFSGPFETLHVTSGDGYVFARRGKKAAGATLDGREWREFPA